MPTVIGIAGALRRGSYNAALLRGAAELAPPGLAIEIASIRDIPFYDGDLEAERGIPEPVRVLKDRIAAAAGLLLVTPEYNNSIPGVFKNAIDWLSRPANDIPRVFGQKPVALMGATPGRGGTMLAHEAWLAVLRTLGTHTWFGPRLYVSNAAKVFDENGRIVDETVRVAPELPRGVRRVRRPRRDRAVVPGRRGLAPVRRFPPRIRLTSCRWEVARISEGGSRSASTGATCAPSRSSKPSRRTSLAPTRAGSSGRSGAGESSAGRPCASADPPMDPFLRLARALGRARVRFVVIGLSGMNLHARSASELFSTQDRDLFIPLDPDNALAAWGVSEKLGLDLRCGSEPLDRPRDRLVADRVIANRALVRATDHAGLDVDFSLVMAGFDFETVWNERRIFRVEGVEIPVARLAHIVESKRRAGRAKDRLFFATHAEAIRDLLGAERDETRGALQARRGPGRGRSGKSRSRR